MEKKYDIIYADTIKGIKDKLNELSITPENIIKIFYSDVSEMWAALIYN